jgi:murein DD-endopeptidase MepM/ murein hydrolase activator NlpD
MKKPKAIMFLLVLMMLVILMPTRASAEKKFHKVKQGDCVSKLAWLYGISQKEIIESNKLKVPSYVIRIGNELEIPDGGTKPIAISGKRSAPHGASAEKNNLKVKEDIEKSSFNLKDKTMMTGGVTTTEPTSFNINKLLVDCTSDKTGLRCDLERKYLLNYKAEASVWNVERSISGIKRFCLVIVQKSCGNTHLVCRTEVESDNNTASDELMALKTLPPPPQPLREEIIGEEMTVDDRPVFGRNGIDTLRPSNVVVYASWERSAKGAETYRFGESAHLFVNKRYMNDGAFYSGLAIDSAFAGTSTPGGYTQHSNRYGLGPVARFGRNDYEIVAKVTYGWMHDRGSIEVAPYGIYDSWQDAKLLSPYLSYEGYYDTKYFNKIKWYAMADVDLGHRARNTWTDYGSGNVNDEGNPAENRSVFVFGAKATIASWGTDNAVEPTIGGYYMHIWSNNTHGIGGGPGLDFFDRKFQASIGNTWFSNGTRSANVTGVLDLSRMFFWLTEL